MYIYVGKETENQKPLTAILINGCVCDFISSDDAIGLSWLGPTELSDSWADDIEGQTPRFTGN